MYHSVRLMLKGKVLLSFLREEYTIVGACNIIKSGLNTREILVIMVSAREDRLDQEYAKEMGADGYVIKPFDAQELWDTVNRFLANPK